MSRSRSVPPAPCQVVMPGASTGVRQLDPPESPGVAVAEPPPAVENDVPAVSPRRPDGAMTRFDEIVTPHPVVAFLFRRRTFIVLLAILALVPWAKPSAPMLISGVVCAILAECIRIWAAGTIHKTAELTTGGPYAYV